MPSDPNWNREDSPTVPQRAVSREPDCWQQGFTPPAPPGYVPPPRRGRRKPREGPGRPAYVLVLFIALAALTAALAAYGSGGATGPRGPAGKSVTGQVVCVHGSRHLVTGLSRPVNGKCPGSREFRLP